MLRKLAGYKYMIATLLYASLFFTQSLTLTWTVGYIVQALILNTAIMLGIYAFRGFDNSTTSSMNSCFVSYLSGTILGVVFAMIPILFFHARLPRFTIAITAALSIFIFPFIGCILMRYTIKHMPPRRYLVIGREEELSPILEEVRKASMNKIQIYSYLNPSPATLAAAIEMEMARPYDAILIGDPQLARGVDEILSNARMNNESIEYLPKLIEDTLQRIPEILLTKFKDYYDVLFSDAYTSKRMRVLDIILASFLLLLSSPFLLFAMIYILARDGRPVFFRQERAGYLGKTYKLLKLRTMDDIENEDGVIETVNTKSGKILRKFRLNEIPQLINVIKGEMSLVGCRPDLPWQHQKWSLAFPKYSARMNYLPGITGHAQVMYKYVNTDEEVRKRLEYDLYYIKNRCVKLYLITIMRTFETVLLGRGK